MAESREPYFYAMELLPGIDPSAAIEAGLLAPAPAPLALRMVQTRRYDPPPHCLYCLEYGTTEEHIIPLMLGGRLVLASGSCEYCQAIINQVETFCAEANFQFGRVHFGLRGRRAKGMQTRGRIRHAPHVDGPFRAEGISLDEHPGALVLTVYQRGVQILRGEEPADIPHNTSITFVGKHLSSPILQKGNVIQLGGSHPILFGRLLAKIAHGYASAELGQSSFTPMLREFILGNDDRHPAYWMETGPEESPEETLHSISLVSHPLDCGGRYVIAKVRLFASVQTPVYYVVVGERVV